MGPNSAVESVEFGSQLISAVCGDFKLVPSEFRSNADVAYIATLRFRIMFRLRLRLRIMFRQKSPYKFLGFPHSGLYRPVYLFKIM